ncbi:hypothetical protein NQ317_000506 [Molorchus minor]|uniref:RING-type E3 ubiquitin transferase n=1 Tax=Molorchus minor TaxID=1323400 RepID=A0ABQ9JPY3_9CUCU|nr:hypothetical protein NQ317_000506 [Molorchus minor]
MPEYVKRICGSSSTTDKEVMVDISVDHEEHHPFHLEISILSELECLICRKYMFSPLQQCMSGHIFCTSCFDEIQECPICRKPKSNSRCFTLEKIQSWLLYPCEYEYRGCTYSDTIQVIESHQTVCKFAPAPCPFKYRNNNCRWRGLHSDVIAHCKRVHSENIFTSPRKMFTSSIEKKDTIHVTVFEVFNTHFQFCWCLDKVTGYMRFVTYCLDETTVATNFSFQIVVFKKNSYFNAFFLKGPCHSYETDMDISDMFNDEKCLLAFFDTFNMWCDEKGDSKYAVKIIKN